MISLDPQTNGQLTYAELAQAWTTQNADTFTYLIDEPDYDRSLSSDDGSTARWYKFLEEKPSNPRNGRSIALVHRSRVQSSILAYLLRLRDCEETVPIDQHAIEEVEFLSSRLLLMEEGGRCNG